MEFSQGVESIVSPGSYGEFLKQNPGADIEDYNVKLIDFRNALAAAKGVSVSELHRAEPSPEQELEMSE